VTLLARHGSHEAEIREYRPHPSIYDGPLWVVAVDGDPVTPGECHVELDDAKREAERVVGHRLDWSEA
jgi:hypothetical protein